MSLDDWFPAESVHTTHANTAVEEILDTYDVIIVYFSGGKDSLACLLYLIFVLKVPLSKIEVHHHDIDGNIDGPGKRGRTLWDWEVTVDYSRKICEYLGVAFYVSYREGGIEAEMTRQNGWTGQIHWQNPDGTWGSNKPRRYNKAGDPIHLGTRMRVAQVVADLSKRWCSSTAKIDVGESLIRNSRRFDHKRILTVSGERAQESTNRAGYNVFEHDRAHSRVTDKNNPRKDKDGNIIYKKAKSKDYTRFIKKLGKIVAKANEDGNLLKLGDDGNFHKTPEYSQVAKCIPNFEECGSKNHVDRWRPIKEWKVEEVWAIIEKYKIVPHPAYILGWGRLSCRNCIFGSSNQWTTSHLIAPEQVLILAEYEEIFGQFHLDNCTKDGCTICANISKREIPAYTIHRTKSIRERIIEGTPYPLEGMEDVIALATSEIYYGDITTDDWQEPAGFWGETCGPS